MRPLDGITIVALEHVIAAPFATRQLADLGARVIKIERPGSGDFARNYDQRAKGMSSHFTWVNRSKESLTLDLKHESAMLILKKLLLMEALPYPLLKDFVQVEARLLFVGLFLMLSLVQDLH